ncbi:cysteine sulfinic acid decarboxylase-like [Hyposmocoma kahamanoa]|uniref:cysteine sulfinic acid decarboxylase-like n=1 Tax=Hyposmocoma kahamanoa TaxID=1477025 RepID=UPI000E6D79DD|nr:cysteine sulfinic acid decarboxylase-like [Hyposmocoma kahamanoa]
MANNDKSFLDKVLNMVKEETSKDVPLIQFKHPKELEKILDLDVTKGVSDEKLEVCVRQILQFSVKTNKATFRNQLYGALDPYGLAGAWVAEAFNTSQYTFEVAPAFTLIELKIINHILKLFGIPDGDGIFSPGGSMSMMYAVVAARYNAFPDVKRNGMWNLPKMILFTSKDSHYSIMKAAHWLGLGTDCVRVIKADERGVMVTEALNKAIEEEIEANNIPLLVNATAGTTVLGAIDDLQSIAATCKKFGVWLHVDACWGGSLILSSKYRYRLKGIEQADSVSWNPHKMVGVPLQCSVFLVRKRGLLHRANAAAAQYLFQQDKFYDVSYDTGDKSVQCGRKIDAFKLWLLWKARGDSGLERLTDRVMHIAEFCMASIASREGFRLVHDQLDCPNVCFWYIPRFMRGHDENQQWWELMHKITPKIKELLTLSSQLMVAYSPVREYKNFFRLAFTFHPLLEEWQVINMLDAVELCGEQVTSTMIHDDK